MGNPILRCRFYALEVSHLCGPAGDLLWKFGYRKWWILWISERQIWRMNYHEQKLGPSLKVTFEAPFCDFHAFEWHHTTTARLWTSYFACWKPSLLREETITCRNSLKCRRGGLHSSTSVALLYIRKTLWDVSSTPEVQNNSFPVMRLFEGVSDRYIVDKRVSPTAGRLSAWLNRTRAYLRPTDLCICLRVWIVYSRRELRHELTRPKSRDRHKYLHYPSAPRYPRGIINECASHSPVWPKMLQEAPEP